jgi:tRNA modification GTPase
MTFRDTIAAIATPPGVGGIGLIRISGPAAQEIARQLFRPSRPLAAFRSHRLYHGKIVAPGTDRVLDEVLAALMTGPRSYTGEDTLEISCHGGPLVLHSVLEAVCQAGARPAERGEFTRRAFLNDRLSLSEAEAVDDIITARTQQGLQAALDRLCGKLTRRIESLRAEIIGLLAGIEAVIDFSSEDGVVETTADERPDFERIIDGITALAATYRRGRILREGAGVVIAGRPNVGKSSLLNRLLGEKRAIVAALPGTTRDFIEETLDIGGIPVRLTDTAGIRSPQDAIEREGVELVWERLETADLVLLLLDGSAEPTAEDHTLIARLQDKPLLPVINKTDLPPRLTEADLSDLLPPSAPPPVRISAKYGQGIDRLQQALRERLIASPAPQQPDMTIACLRHKLALAKAAESLTRARDGLRENLAPELAALEIRTALDALDEITGRTTADEVLDRIFSKFCVGK